MKYLLVFSQSLFDFRLAELDSVVKVLNINLSRPKDEYVDLNSACLVVEIASEAEAKALAGRCVLIKWVSMCIDYQTDKTPKAYHPDNRRRELV